MKKVLKSLFLLWVLLLTPMVLAKEPTLCDRADMENYGVNKKWKITDINIINVKTTPCVNAKDKIYDFSGVLTDDEYNKLKQEIGEYIKETKMDLVIVIDDIPYSNDSMNEEYAADFYDYNDFGIEYDRYSGSLLLRNTYEQDPYYDIYTFGDAQLYYDYNRLQVILDGIYDDLHNGKYYDGFHSYIEFLKDYYKQGKALDNYKVDENGYLQKVYRYPFVIIFVISTIVTAIVMSILVKKNKMVLKATEASEYLNKTSTRITNRQDQFISTHTSSYTTSSSSGGGGGGGHHSSGGSSGGGHSSGGGRHG